MLSAPAARPRILHCRNLHVHSDFAVLKKFVRQLSQPSSQHRTTARAPTRDQRTTPRAGRGPRKHARRPKRSHPTVCCVPSPLPRATSHVHAPATQQAHTSHSARVSRLDALQTHHLSGNIHVTLYTLSPNSTCTRWEWNIWINTGSCSPRASYSRRVTLAATHAWACDRESDDWTTHDTRATQVWSAK